MSLEGTIRDLGLQEIGQLLSLSRKSGVLGVRSRLRAARAWIRFVDGAIVDAGRGEPLADGEATEAARAGDRPAVEEATQDVLAWREGTFAFTPAVAKGAGASQVRIPTDAMLVESARRDDVWRRIRDRIASTDVIPSFVDIAPKALPLLHLVPLQWEVLTQVDGMRDLRALAALLQREVLEVAEVVHGLVGTGLLTVREPSLVLRPTPLGVPAQLAALPLDGTPDEPPSSVTSPGGHDGTERARHAAAPVDAGVASAALPHDEDSDRDPDDLWIPETAEMAIFLGDPSDAVFDPQRAGLVTRGGAPVAAVTAPAPDSVASTPAEPSIPQERREHPAELRRAGEAAARVGAFATALSCWERYLRAHAEAPDADRVREMVDLVTRLHGLLGPPSSH